MLAKIFKFIILKSQNKPTFITNKVKNYFRVLEVTRKETCDFLKISLTTLWHWTNKGKIDSYGIGNRVYYKKVDLLNSLVLLK